MAFKENYKDEIATRRYQIIDNKTGAIINPDVALKRIDTPTQIGDRFMAKDVNAIHECLNDILDGTQSVAKTSQLEDIKAIRNYHVIANPGGRNYFDVARATNQYIIPMHLSGATNSISYIQYAPTSVRIVLHNNVTGEIDFSYLIVYF